MLVILQYDYKEATVLSLCAVLGNHCAQTCINWFKSHPKLASRSLIYWNLVMIFLPAQLSGSTLSTSLSASFPETPLLLIAMMVVLFAVYKSIEKGRYMYASEKLEAKQFSLPPTLNEGFDDGTDDNNVLVSSSSEPLLVRLNDEKPKIQFDMFVFLCIATAWIYYAALYLVLAFGVEKCSILYFAMLGGSFLPLIGFLHLCGRYLIMKQTNGEPVLEGDIVFSQSTTIILPLAALGIGFFCVLLGLGSAEITAPYFLSLGIPPIVSSASTSIISLLYTSSSLFHYAVLGRIDYEAAAVMFAVGLAGGVTGRSFALYVLQRYKRASFICFIIAFILFIGFGLLVDDVITNERDWGFHSFC